MGNRMIPLLGSLIGGGNKTKIKYISVAADFPTKLEADGYVWDFYVFTANVTDNDPTKTNTGQTFLAGEEAVWNLVNYTVFGASALWGDNLTDLTPINPRDINVATGQIYKINNQNIFTRLNSELKTFDKSVWGGINEQNAYWNKVHKDISYFLTSPATQTLATSGAGDLAAKIATLIDGDILEIQTDASYSQITIPAGKRFAIRVKLGYHVQLNTAQAILLSNSGANVFLSGFILDGNPGGSHSQGSGIAFVHQAQLKDITLHNCTCRNNNHSAVLLSYHQSTGGDNYTTANLLSEFSERIAFVDCHFFGASNEATEGGAITARGIKHLLIENCTYNGQDLARQIHLQNCIEAILISTDVQRGGGAGNGEAFKFDKIGTPVGYKNSAIVINCRAKDCIEGFDIDDDAEVICIDCIAEGCSAEGFSVDDSGKGTLINCIGFNNTDGVRQEVGADIELKGCNFFNNKTNDYRMDGGYTPDSSNISDPDQTFFNWVNFPVIQKEPTGFTKPEDIIVTYDSSARTVTLTGTVNGYFRGKRVPALVNGYVSPTHSVTNGRYYLVYNDSGFQWVIDGSQKFYDLLIAFVNYGVSYKWGQRECHGLLPWQSHKIDHDTIGTYRESGGTFDDYLEDSITVTDRQPSVSACLLKDEDLPTLNPLLTASGNYNNFYLSSTETANFNKTATDIVPLSTNQPYWNEFTGGAWQQTLMSNNYYMSIWVAEIPVTADAVSQDYRLVWIQGQNETFTIIEQRALEPKNNVNIGELNSLTPEINFIGQIIIQYLGNNWVIKEINELKGTKASQVGAPAGAYLSVVTSDPSLTGLGTVSSPLSVAGGSEDLWDRLKIRVSPEVYVIEPAAAHLNDGIALNGFMPNLPDIPSTVKYLHGLFDVGSGVPAHRSYLYSPTSTYPNYSWSLANDFGATTHLAMTLSYTELNIGSNKIIKTPIGLTFNPQSSAPATADGTVYYNSTATEFQFRENGVWNTLKATNLWDRISTVLQPHNVGDDVDLGTGNLRALNVSAESGPSVTGLSPGFLLIRNTLTTISADNIFQQIANWNSAPAMIGTETSILVQQKVEGGSLEDMSYMTWGTETNWALPIVSRDGYFDFYLTRKGIKTKVYSIVTDPVYTNEHLFKIEGGLVINANSATPIAIDNIHTPNQINMICGSTIFSVISSGIIDQDLRVANWPTWNGIIYNPRTSAPASGNGTVYYNSTLNKFQFRENGVWETLSASNYSTFISLTDTSSSYTTALALWRSNGTPNGIDESTTLLLQPLANAFGFQRGSSTLTVNTTCTINQDISTASTPSWPNISLTNTAPPNGLAISLATLPTFETGIGVNNNNKFIYNNPNGPAVISSENITLIVDSDNTTTSTAKVSFRANTIGVTAGFEFFKVIEHGRALLKCPAGIAGSTALFEIDTTDLTDQSMLQFSKGGVKQWQLTSRNQIDSPNNRLSIYNAGGSQVWSMLQDGSLTLPNIFHISDIRGISGGATVFKTSGGSSILSILNANDVITERYFSFHEYAGAPTPSNGYSSIYVDSATGDLKWRVQHGAVTKTYTLQTF